MKMKLSYAWVCSRVVQLFCPAKLNWRRYNVAPRDLTPELKERMIRKVSLRMKNEIQSPIRRGHPLNSGHDLIRLTLVLLIGAVPFSLSGGTIHEAVNRGDVREIRTLLAITPAAVNATNGVGDTPLHLAAMRGDFAV